MIGEQMSKIIINGYIFDKPLTSDNSGFSKWGIGRLRGKRYFVKEFLSPVYPIDSSLFSEQKIQERLGLCASFVDTKRELYAAIDEVTDGNLVGVEEFFRVGAKYYMSTAAIEQRPLTIREVSLLTFVEKIQLFCIISHAIARLHSKRIIHADLKPDNILIFSDNTLRAKIIDFDCSFFESNAPKLGEELNGDMVYLSPEAFLHIFGESSNLTCKMDVFALGLLFHQYLTGLLPMFDTEEYQYAYEAVLDDQKLVVNEKINSTVLPLIKQMLDKNPDNRPDMENVFLTLRKLLLFMLKREIPEPNNIQSVVSNETDNSSHEDDFFTLAGDL